MKACILTTKGDFPSVNFYSAWAGFRELGAEIVRFEPGAFDALALAPDTIVIGGIGFTRRALMRLGAAPPELPDVPEALTRFARRRVGVCPIGAVRAAPLVSGMTDQFVRPRFIKPLASAPKQFTGHVVRSARDLVLTADLPDGTLVQDSDVVAFTHEARAFIRQGEIIGWKPYRGAPGGWPEVAVVRDCITAWPEQPRAWSADVGLLETGETALVEVNDAYALGCYGLEPVRYAAMIAERWYELVGRPDLAAALPPATPAQ